MSTALHDESFWAELEDIDCPCQGNGWANIDNEWAECPLHFYGQLHPETRDLLLDDPTLAETERKSVLNWRIAKARTELAEMQVKVRHAQYDLHVLELELINKTATQQMKAVNINELLKQTTDEYITISSIAHEIK